MFLLFDRAVFYKYEQNYNLTEQKYKRNDTKSTVLKQYKRTIVLKTNKDYAKDKPQTRKSASFL